MKFLNSIALVLLFCAHGYAQRDTLSFRERYMPTGVRVGTDAISIVRNFYDESFQGWEVNADVDFHRYFLALEYGTWSREYPDELVSYSNKGRYWRVGADVNFLTKDPKRNVFFLGMRYARSNFDETFRVYDTDDNWGINDRLSNPYRNTNIPSRWLELTTGLKVKMFSWFWMGYTARFKFGLATGETDEMEPHDIPGYGKTNKETTWGFNYQLMFRIPFRAYPPLPPVKKKKRPAAVETTQ